MYFLGAGFFSLSSKGQARTKKNPEPGWRGEDTFGLSSLLNFLHVGVSKNSGTPKWMVKIMENPIKMDDLGGTTIFGNIHVAPSFIDFCIQKDLLC